MGKTYSTFIPSCVDNRPYIQISINNKVVSFLYDTSSKNSSIDLQLFHCLNIEQKNSVQKKKYIIDSFGKVKKLRYVVCDIKLVLDQTEIVFPFQIFVNKQFPSVLGIDFIHAFGLSYCALDQAVLFGSKKMCLPLQAGHHLNQVRQVHDVKHVDVVTDNDVAEKKSAEKILNVVTHVDLVTADNNTFYDAVNEDADDDTFYDVINDDSDDDTVYDVVNDDDDDDDFVYDAVDHTSVGFVVFDNSFYDVINDID